MESLNKVYLVLLPKTPGAECIGDFWPISLSNSIYLIIAKVVANCLREVLEGLISPFQSAFIPGRRMIDNIMLAKEMVASWHQSGTAGFMWKVDFAKAYDSINWRFLWNVLRRHGFPEVWVRWIKLCVTTASFSVLVNGQPHGVWFQPQRGIRQGCPLAPLLLILAADALAICTTRLRSQGYLSGFQWATATFFVQGSEAAARTLSSMMDIFSDFSGLQLNRAKSIFVGFGLSTEESRCASHLGTLISTLPVRYLGVLLTDRRLRVQDWKLVIDKVDARLGGWRSHLLSRGGRLVLVKAVFSAIPAYFMPVFCMPAGVRH